MKILSILPIVFLFSFLNINDKNPGDGYSNTTIINGEIKVPQGFEIAVVAENIEKARHITMSSKGIMYVKSERAKGNNGIVVLKQNNETGKFEKIASFGNYGGTGIAFKNNTLYASSNEAVYKYKVKDDGTVSNPESPELLVSGLINKRQHESKSITLDNAGNIYVNIGAPSNSCQEQDRTPGSMGMKPCPILDSAGGVWQFSTSRLNQTYKDGKRYATGLRNVVGLDWNKVNNQLYVMQHGRDQLNQLFSTKFDQKQSAELPAETMYAIKEGDNAGWPYIYYDPFLKKKIVAPEYGGDGKKEGGKEYIDPVVSFPAHLAPNALLFYTGNQFPEKYRNGAFIAFHGSWNRAPEPQKGFFVAFVPFKNGKPSGEWEIFADNFAGKDSVESPGDAKHRPMGLAQGPDGSLYVSDDVQGTIFQITYKK